MSNCSICIINRTLSGTTIVGQNGLGGDGNEEILRIPQNSSITGASPSDCLLSYAGHSLGESYLSVEMHLVYSAASADWAKGYTLWESCPSVEIQSVYSAAPGELVTGHSVGESYPSVEKELMYSAATRSRLTLMCFIILLL